VEDHFAVFSPLAGGLEVFAPRARLLADRGVSLLRPLRDLAFSVDRNLMLFVRHQASQDLAEIALLVEAPEVLDFAVRLSQRLQHYQERHFLLSRVSSLVQLQLGCGLNSN